MSLLPPSNEVCEGYVFTPVCQSFRSQGGRGVHSCGGHAWLQGDVHGCGGGGACVVAGGGHAWLRGACVVAAGHAWVGGHAWDTTRYGQ